MWWQLVRHGLLEQREEVMVFFRDQSLDALLVEDLAVQGSIDVVQG